MKTALLLLIITVVTIGIITSGCAKKVEPAPNIPSESTLALEDPTGDVTIEPPQDLATLDDVPVSTEIPQ